MYYLADDPWPVIAILGVAALGFLIALRVTQDGRYLIRAGVALGLAGLVFAVEQFWVTDSERIEAVVYELARAVRASDAEGAIKLMATEVGVVQGDDDLGTVDPGMLRGALANTRFDLLRIDKLNAVAGARTRMGTATFRTLAHGFYGQRGDSQGTPFGPLPATWDLGFREAGPGVWKVTRITPTSLPAAAEFVLRGAMRRSR